jgi:hypothetical protein
MRTPTTLTKQELSSMKHNLFDMLKNSGKMEEPYYESHAESLDGLNFQEYSPDDYAMQLSETVDGMIDLDDLSFDIGQLYKYQAKLS